VFWGVLSRGWKKKKRANSAIVCSFSIRFLASTKKPSRKHSSFFRFSFVLFSLWRAGIKRDPHVAKESEAKGKKRRKSEREEEDEKREHAKKESIIDAPFLLPKKRRTGKH